jgi:hypothetical protein
MMDELAHRPSAVAIGGVQLVCVQVIDGVAQLAGEFGQSVDGVAAIGGGYILRADEPAHGIARVCRIHGLNWRRIL